MSQSGTFGNTFVHNNGEMTVFNSHNFDNGGSGVMPGIVGTTRNLNAFFSFTGSGAVTSVSDQAHVDGYVKNYNIPNFIFPVGDNQQYGPIGISANTINGPISAAYFNANPNIAVTSSLLGGNEVPLPSGAPFPTTSHDPDIIDVSKKEYWDLNGTSPVVITLFWNPASDINTLTSNVISTLTITGWDGTKWVSIPSTIDIDALLISGSISSNTEIIPNQFSIYTFASLDCENKPILTVGNVICNNNDYSIEFFTNGQIINLNAGIISGNVITGVPLGVDLKIVAQNNGCLQTILVSGPISCHTTCQLPLLTLGQPVCDGNISNTYSSSFTLLTQATISTNAGSISGNSIIDIPVGIDLIITATQGQCNVSYRVKSPANCVKTCPKPLISFSGPICSTDQSSYQLNYVLTNGAQINSDYGIVSSGKIMDIPIQFPVTINISKSNCSNESITIFPPACKNNASIGNFVWNDLNGDGQQQIDEPAIPNIQVNLYRNNGAYLSTQYTNNVGNYIFENLYPDLYYLEFYNPPGYDKTFPNRGSNTSDSDIDGSNGPGTTGTIKIIAGQIDDTWDAGFYKCVPIGDLVWYDLNGNDIWDTNENGINGIKVNLWRNHFGNWLIWNNTYTGQKPGSPSDDGYFNFCAPPGEYYVEVIMPPSGLVRARPNVGINEEIDSDIFSNGKTPVFQVMSGQTKTDLGAGFYPMAIVGNLVWRDDNSNGLQDPFEPGITGVKVEAIESSTGNVARMSYTDTQGIYVIDYLEKQEYYFKFTPPSGYSPTIPKVGPDNLDSDVDHSLGPNTTRVFIFQPGSTNDNIDLGLLFGILPLNWLEVMAYREDDRHVINWKTANEINVSHYIVERKIDKEIAFTNIIENVKANGIFNEINNYSESDADISKSGPFYYRIKQVDFDGSFSYSPIVKIEKDIVSSIELYPNPAFDEATLTIDLVNDTKLGIELYGNSAQLIKVIKEVGEEIPGEKKYKIDLTGYDAGMYKIIVNIDGHHEVKRLLKIK